MNGKIQFLCLGFSAGLVAFAVAPQVETEAKAELQRPSIWSVEETEPSTERGEVIELSDSILDAVESTKPAASLPAGPFSEQQEPIQENGTAMIAETKVQGPLNTPAALTFIMNGKQHDFHSFIDDYYRRPWTYPGEIDSHIMEHGVEPSTIQGLSHSQKEQLHAAIHEHESQVKPTVKKSLQAQTYSNCPGGVCPSPNYSYQTMTRGQQRRAARRR